jgi:hypothetical protein
VKGDCECRAVGRQETYGIADADSAMSQRGGKGIDTGDQTAVAEGRSGCSVDKSETILVLILDIGE